MRYQRALVTIVLVVGCSDTADAKVAYYVGFRTEAGLAPAQARVKLLGGCTIWEPDGPPESELDAEGYRPTIWGPDVLFERKKGSDVLAYRLWFGPNDRELSAFKQSADLVLSAQHDRAWYRSENHDVTRATAPDGSVFELITWSDPSEGCEDPNDTSFYRDPGRYLDAK